MDIKYAKLTVEKPILRWAGGKSWLLKYLDGFLPKDFNNYHEPFLGAGSVFFSLKPQGKSFLSDKNSDLINTYIQIRDRLDDLILLLKKFKNTKEDYYKIRSTVYNTDLENAAQFIYLNRTSYNGIYRVNLKGGYNVPYGFKNYINLFEFERYKKASQILQNTYLRSYDFEKTLINVQQDDLVFLDPPYTVSHIRNGFIKYNEKLFSWYHQEKLADYISEIVRKKAYYILTNAKHKSVEKLFGKLSEASLRPKGRSFSSVACWSLFALLYIF